MTPYTILTIHSHPFVNGPISPDIIYPADCDIDFMLLEFSETMKYVEPLSDDEEYGE